MTKLRRLKEEAGQAATVRGHDLSRFRQITETCAVAECRNCGRSVAVETRPPANGIEVGGAAVALNCDG